MSEWNKNDAISRRVFGRLAGLAAAFVGATAAGKITSVLDPSESERQREFNDPYGAIHHWRTAKTSRYVGFDHDTVMERNAMLPVEGVPGEIPRQDYIYSVFMTEKTTIPEGIRATLAEISHGILAQESRYSELTNQSSADARGIAQLRRSTFEDAFKLRFPGQKSEYASQSLLLRIAAPVVFTYFDRYIYPAVAEPAQAVAKLFGLTEETEIRKFIVLCMVNAYNTGPTRMRDVLLAISARKKSAPRLVTPNAVALHFALSKWAREAELVRGYGKDSQEYVEKVLAGAESLNNMLRIAQKDRTTFLQETIRRKATLNSDILVPAVAGFVGGMIGKEIQMKFSGEVQDVSIPLHAGHLSSRMTLAAALASAGVMSHAYWDSTEGSLKLFDIWNTEDSSAKGLTFPDGTRYNESTRTRFTAVAAGFLANLLKQSPPPLREFQRNLMPASEAQKALEANKSQNILLADISGNTEKYRALSEVPEVNQYMRCRGVGTVGAVRNEQAYRRVSKDSLAQLQAIGEQFHEAIRASGLPQGWSARFVVTDLLRSLGKGGTAERVTTRSLTSGHTMGRSIDISSVRFDIVSPEKDFFMATAQTDGALVKGLQQILANVLIAQHRKKEIYLTSEMAQNHFHITILPRK